MADVREMPGRRPDGRRRLYIWGGVLLVILVLAGAGIYITEQSWFCGRVCHEMRASYDGWVESPHPNVRCTECHVNPGIGGWFEGHVQDGLRDVWRHFVVRPKTVTVEPEPIPPSNCMRCHDEQFEDFANGRNADDENALPEDHPARDSDCAECHYDEIHDGAPRAGD